jgi:hypothetical protein
MRDGYLHKNYNYTNRSSCIFPVLISKVNDVNIVFLNYWKIKNNLQSILCNIRIYDENGLQKCLISKNITQNHNNISIKSILKDDTNFKGIANIEFISQENFGFTFPAVTAFYRSNSNYSGVHTAGRIKNTEESKIPGRIIETNWRCKWSDGITPFFTLFNGSLKGEKTYANLKIFNPNNDLLISKNILINLTQPFSNRFYFLDELIDFNKLELKENCYIQVEVPYTDFFPRMICGNFFKKENFLEVTHSFENQKDNPDYLIEVNDEDTLYRVPSINPIATENELNLKLLFFPTNCEGNAIGSWRKANFGEPLRNSNKSFEWVCGGKNSKLKEVIIDKGNEINALDITKGKIPTRINTNYIYTVDNTNSRYSTDIAAGQITEHFPPKRFTWGHGIIGKDYKTIIFLTSFSHDEKTKTDSRGELTLLIGQKEFVSNHNIPAESGIKINLNNMIKDKFVLSDNYLISWYYTQEKRTKLISYWISYTNSGQITGDHAF